MIEFGRFNLAGPMLPKIKPFPLINTTSPLFALSQSCVFILAANWVMQGMRGMDSKELSFRILLEGSVATALLLAIPSYVNPWQAVVMSVMGAHTASFLFNGQVWVCARYCRMYNRSPSAIDSWLADRIAWLRSLGWLDVSLCIGSQGQGTGTRTSRSDIDLRLIFPPGGWNWLRLNGLLLLLRTEAFIRAIPLDLYAYDTIESLKRFDPEEPIMVITDRQDHLARTMGHRIVHFAP